MATSDPFIVRGEFIYHSALFVDVGGTLKRHARASSSEIKTLLDGKAPKDQVAHWYEAQLIHYGLQRSKDKNTAKVRLQQALSQKKLTVPAHIVDMEAQMKKEYAASVKKARSAAGKTAVEDGVVARGKKRKLSEANPEPETVAGKKTRITMRIGDVEVSIDHDSSGARSTEPSGKVTKTKTVSSKSAKASSLAKSKAADAPASTRKQPTKPQARETTRDDAQPSSASAYGSSGTPMQPVNLPFKVSAFKKATVKAEPKVKKEQSSGHHSPSKTTPKIKPEVKPEPYPTESSSDRYITGVYNVTSSQLSEQYSHEANNLRLFLCVDNEAVKSGAASSSFPSPESCASPTAQTSMTSCPSAGGLETRTAEGCHSDEIASVTFDSPMTDVSLRLYTTCSPSRSNYEVRGGRDRCGAGRVRGSSSVSGMDS